MRRLKLKKLVDRTLVLYLLVGVLNFILCTALMFFLFNVCGFSEHVAPLVNYGLGSLIWYLACRWWLFREQRTTLRQILRFLIDVLVCYALSYYLIAPLLSPLLLRSSAVENFFSFGGDTAEMVTGNCEMAIGSVAYAIINYFGQRYYVFSGRFEKKNRA